MRIEVSVPGIRKARGKLPQPTTLGALKLAVPRAAGSPICGELVDPSLCGPVTGTEVVATEHPVNTETIKAKPSASASEPAVTDVCLHPVSDRGALLRLCRLCGVQFPVALFDTARPFVPGNDDTDVVWTSPLACGRYFLLRLASCQGEDSIAEGWRGALAASRSCGCRPPSAYWSWSGLWCCGRRSGWGGLSCLCALAVAREHSLGRLQFAELAGELFALRIDARERFADPLLLFGDLV